MRDGHRTDAERVLARAVEEEVRRSGGRSDGNVLLSRARGALDTMAESAAEEYGAYTHALDEAEAGRLSFAQRYAREGAGTPLLVAAVAAVAAAVSDLVVGTDTQTALGVGLTVGVVGAAATVVKVAGSHLPAAHHRAGAASQPGGPEQLRLQWLTALEVRGIRPFLDQQRVLAASTGPKKTGPQLRGADKSGAARGRSVLAQSFAQLPDIEGVFAGRRVEMGRIRQWVQASRASTTTRPTVVVLHGAPGSGRTTLAVRAAHELRDHFRGACVVDLRGGSPEEPPLPTRDALLHLLNRLGAPREQLLFRERSSPDQQVKRLSELYQQHLTRVAVTVVLDDASDPAQVRALIPERSDSLVLVTAARPLDPADLPGDVHQLPVTALDAAGSEELLEAAAQDSTGPYDAESAERIRELCGGLPLALSVAGSALGPRSPRRLATDLGVYGPVEPVERALWLRYTDQSDPARRLLRRLALAGRASLGAAAAAALLSTDETEARRHLAALSRAGLIDHVRGSRYRLHDLVRAFAHARLLDEEEQTERTAAQERLIVNYAELADSVLRLVDGNMSTRSDRFSPHGFTSLDEALRWLDDESSFITSTLRHAEGVNQASVLNLLGALCDYCLLRGDLYRLGEISELAQAVDQGLLVRSVQWRTGIAARQLGELDKARATLTSVVDLYRDAHHDAGVARALCSLGITLHHQGSLTEAAAKLREALDLQAPPELATDRAWTMHALAAVERDRSHLAEALTLLTDSLVLHRAGESVHGEAWAHFQLGQLALRMGDVPRADQELRAALERYGRTRDARGEAWALTQLARARLLDGDASPAVDELRQAAARHRENEDARGEAWTVYYLGQALEETGDLDRAVRELERSRTMFSRMRDVYGLACARHHSARVTRDQRAAQTGSLRNSGFARQLLVDARADFQRIGVAHGEAWTCLELVVVDAGNGRAQQALALCDEAATLFASYGDRRGEDWARFLRCTLLPYAAPGGTEVGTAVAQEELAQLSRTSHPLRDEKLTEYAAAYRLLLERGVDLDAGWQAWRLGMVPSRHAREVMGVPVADAAR
ncbi:MULTISPECIES: tetratricopeptide repeat protein [Streptomyces]|uniref:Tetratricopeptide repeat protein n=1 Tax=Streptomyces doudnae TaxID=3075536 RepID=A0ABD5EIE5_9ACTN|nr:MULTISPECIES: tetratricopeptide repeat protein [unclassified Streptomyces]MDT0434383.1 tetratricopeptide repeat protein [Streptomyces sp. DSM 41981]MYQ64015.1 tetratricopeptide repeat protein [Streptomyces sp. SID4950]SCD70114.1 Tetratricopeptide repeat-containing protein [Streptomyces sp. SolWspMP-5a-2]